VQLIRQVIPRPVVVIGHSTGAMVALQLGVDVADAVQAVVLEEPGLYLNTHLEAWALYPRLKIVMELLSQPNLHEATLITQCMERLRHSYPDAQSQARRFLQADPDILRQFMDKTFWQGFDTDYFLEHIACPVLLLHGEWRRGSCLTPNDIQRAATSLKHGTIIGLNDVGHGLHQQRPDDFTQVVTLFLDTLDLH
jgi:pimeloyl-ACP methyl ester carboxylesterase